MHSQLLPLLSNFESSEAAVAGLSGVFQIIADEGQALPGSLQEHILQQLDAAVILL